MLIDINTCFGTSPSSRVAYADVVTAARMFDEPGAAAPTSQRVDWSLDNLLAIIDKHQVDRALTYSRRGKLYDFVSGNDETWQAAQEHPQLVPVATIDPRRHIGCLEEVARCVDRGFRVFRFFPHEQGWAISGLPFLNICEELADHDVSVMLPAGPWGQQTEIGRSICDFGFNVVALGATFAAVAESIAVASEYSNFFCETSEMHTAEAVETVASEVGVERLIFGSNSPASYFEAAYSLVAVARLSDAGKAAVFGQNALEYLGLEGST